MSIQYGSSKPSKDDDEAFLDFCNDTFGIEERTLRCVFCGEKVERGSDHLEFCKGVVD